MNILGVHIGHDSGACLVVDGKIVADVAEERFSRVKHYAGAPFKSIRYCLESMNMTIKDIDIIAVPSMYPMPLLDIIFGLKGHKAESKSEKYKIINFARQFTKRKRTTPPIYIKLFPISNKTEIMHVEHHLAHAASAYYTTSAKDKTLIVTCDGAGDGFSFCIWRGENNKIEPLYKMGTEASIGWFYSNVTEALGWWHGDGEGKTMGLAPYGSYERCKGVLDKFYPKYDNGKVVETYNYGIAGMWNEAGAIQWHFDDAIEIKKLIDKCGRENIAAEAQRVLEEQVLKVIIPWLEKEKTHSLACSGGVFLNVKLNQRVWEKTKLNNHHIFPNAGDSGLAAGAALYAYYQNNKNAERHDIDNLYWGPEFSNKEIEDILKLRNLKYQYCENMEEVVVEHLSENKIIAWFQGRMESGPRALGNRSILMSPRKTENKDIINARVKFREAFRPFCPSMTFEVYNDILANARPEYFMITSFDVREDKRSDIPAVVHKDGTVRPQTVKKDFNPKFWELIDTFRKKTGVPVLLNTSFNIMGEPIICNPREAIRCFYDNGIDYLVLGDFILSKQ
jgi:carbamoyltransferase